MKTITSESLMEAGVHYGYSRTRRHPTVSPNLYGTKDGTDIIDIDKTMNQLETATKFLAELGAAGKNVLFVGVKPEARASVIETAAAIRQPYVTERWIGGILTNFPQIKQRIDKLEKMKEERVSGEYAKYTKKEQLLLNREMERLNKYFSGLLGMSKMPEAMVVIDSKKEHIAVLEARKMNIPVIAIGNTDCSIRAIEYPIIANDSATSSIKALLAILQSAFEGNK